MFTVVLHVILHDIGVCYTGQGHQRILVNSTNNPNCKCLYSVNTKYLIICCLQRDEFA